jgi:hypothetical protein
MSDTPEVKVKLTAEDTGVSAAIKELGAQLKNLKKQQDETASSAIHLGSAFSGLIAAAGALKLGAFAKDAFDSAVNIGKMADKTGLSTQTLSVFHKVAGDVGVSTEAVDKGLIKAAKSITQFQQGSATAAQAFALLNITQKDFAGLSPDQKIEKVTLAIGKMAPGFNRATAAQLIFAKGGAELIPVMQALAAQGFDKATAATSKLGLLLDQTTTNSFRVAKASMQELGDAGQGVATQFETGLLPSITDVGEAMLTSIDIGGKSGDGIKELGKTAGTVVKDIAAGFIWMGVTISAEIVSTELIFSEAFGEIKTRGTSVYEALAQAAKGNFAAAKATYEAGSRDISRAQAELAGQQKAIWDDAAVHIRKSMEDLFPSDAEEAQRQKDLMKHLRPEKTTAETPVVNEQGEIEALKRQQQDDKIAKAQAEGLRQHLQDELELLKAGAQQREQIEKNAYDQSELTTAEYYSRRRADLQTQTAAEIAILEAEKQAAKDAAARAASDAQANSAKAKQFGQDSPVGKQYVSAAVKNNEDAIAGLAKVDELQTKIDVTKTEAQTKSLALTNQEADANKKSQQETLDFEKELAELQGKRQQTAQSEIEAETIKRQKQIEQAGGDTATQTRLKAELEQWKTLKLAVADYEQARQKLEQDTKSFETAKSGIELSQKTGKISKLEEERQINELIKQRLPLLQADANAETGAASKTGNADFQAQAQQDKAALANLTISAKDLGNTLGSSVAGSFTTFFETVGRGTQTVAQSFQHLAGSVIQSIEQMLIKLLLLKIAQSATGTSFGQSSFGSGFLSGFGGGHAEGGLIKGPGGPKSDSIPARLSAGEYVVKADAVQKFGAHNLAAINRGIDPGAFANIEFPKFSEGGLVGSPGAPGASGMVRVGIGLDEGLILRHLSSKAAGRIVLEHITNNPKAASKALGRSQG